MRDRAIRLIRRVRLPRRTIRLRLALLYGGLFFISGALLLGIIYAGVEHTHSVYSRSVAVKPQARAAPSGTGGATKEIVEPAEPSGEEAQAAGPAVKVFDPGQHGADLRVLAILSAIVLAAMAVLSMALGWLVAGRVLRPLSTITSAARDISATDLHRRLALSGPDDEFKELGDTFDGLLGRLERAFDAQRQFVANASHELRTPLARLKTLSQVALADPDAGAGELREAHERVLASELQLEQLIDALLGLAGGERAGVARRPVDLAALTGDALSARRAEIERHGLQLHSALNPAVANGAPQLLERLVENVLDNAIRHNSPGGRIDVTTTTSAGAALLLVANDGPAIAEEDLERLQAPFERLGAPRTGQGEGHGLGLSIVRAIAGAHDAELGVRARREGGLEVEVRFPAAP